MCGLRVVGGAVRVGCTRLSVSCVIMSSFYIIFVAPEYFVVSGFVHVYIWEEEALWCPTAFAVSSGDVLYKYGFGILVVVWVWMCLGTHKKIKISAFGCMISVYQVYPKVCLSQVQVHE